MLSAGRTMVTYATFSTQFFQYVFLRSSLRFSCLWGDVGLASRDYILINGTPNNTTQTNTPYHTKTAPIQTQIMALNDRDPTIGGFKSVDVHPGVANPTSFGGTGNPLAANFVDNPTSQDKGAGAGPKFQGGSQAARSLKQTSAVKEGSSGIIETTHIDPLNDNPNKDDGFANGSQTPGSGNRQGLGQKAANTTSEKAGGTAKAAYGTVTGDQAIKQTGKDSIYG